MKPQDIVAILLAATLSVLLLFSGPFRYLVTGYSNEPAKPETVAVFRDILAVLVGALAGYIAGAGNGKN